jgi:methionine synthase II (cobalamin-independent)
MSAAASVPERWWRPGTISTVGSWPGDDPWECARIVAGETPLLPALPELPGRGAGADMIGRTLALVAALPAEVVPSGWRFTGAAGPDARRARSFLRHDLDAFEEGVHDISAPVKLQIVGPLTLAAGVELSSGERAISDHGARADIAAALAEAARDHVAELRRRLPHASTVVLQVDEPGIDAVLRGAVPTASGYRTYRAVDPGEVVRSWQTMVAALHVDGAPVVVHSCADDVRYDLIASAGFDGLSIDATAIRIAHYDALGTAIDDGRALFLGCVPSDRRLQPARHYTDRVQRWWRDLGFASGELAERVVLTPACGLAGRTLPEAREVLTVLQDIVGAVVEDPEGDHAHV